MNKANSGIGMTKPVEEFFLPIRLAEFIVKYIDKEAFINWRDKLGCVNESISSGRKGVLVNLNGATEEENKEKREQILDLLKRAEDELSNPDLINSNREFGVKFVVILRLLIVDQKCGYVRGRQGATLKKIETDCEVNAYFDNGKIEPIPAGFGRLVLKSYKVEGIRAARAEIQHLVELAMHLNPFGPAIGKKAAEIVSGSPLSGKENEQYRERIKLPLFRAFNNEQKAQFKRIQVNSGIDFKLDKTDKPDDGRFLILEGEFAKVIATKKQFAKLINEMQNDKNLPSPSRESVELLVPYPTYREVIGPSGETIKTLKQQLDVSLRFMGDNFEDYPEGRILRIVGYSPEKVQTAKEHIEQEYIHKKRPTQECYSANGITYENMPMGEEVQQEISIPEPVSQKMLKVKIHSGLSSFLRRPTPIREDGLYPVVIRGRKPAVKKARKVLDLMTTAYLEGNPDWANVVEWEEDEKDPVGYGCGSEGKLNGTSNAATRQKQEENDIEQPLSPFPSTTDDEQNNGKTANRQQQVENGLNGNDDGYEGEDDSDDRDFEQAIKEMNKKCVPSSRNFEGNHEERGGEDQSEVPEIIMNGEGTDNKSGRTLEKRRDNCTAEIDEAFRQAMEAGIGEEDEEEEDSGEHGTRDDEESRDTGDRISLNGAVANEKGMQFMARIRDEEKIFTARITERILEEEKRFMARIRALFEEQMHTVQVQTVESSASNSNDNFEQQMKRAFHRELATTNQANGTHMKEKKGRTKEEEEGEEEGKNDDGGW